MESTERDLKKDEAHYLLLARLNYAAIWTIYFFSVVSSVLATILATVVAASAAGSFTKSYPWLLPVLTAIPGGLLLLNNAFKFSARSLWHFEKSRQLAALFRLYRAKANGADPAEVEVAEKWNQIDENMDKIWPGWGDLTKPPTPPNPLKKDEPPSTSGSDG
jgi:hypothetical protein